jgi:nicotinate-nucleotide pyrophosphorylase (carboxylating)
MATSGASERTAVSEFDVGHDTGAYAEAVHDAVDRALAEDLGPEGDLTAALVPKDVRAQFALRARRSGVLAGCDCVTETYRRVGPEIDLRWRASDGDELSAGDTVLELAGPLRPILTAERTALNFLGRLSGIATLTAQYVTAAHESNPSVAVLDTRKTTPGLRLLEKAAVRAGGGTSHRFSLSDAVLVKDNHLAGLSIGEAVARAKELWPGRMVEVECDHLSQVDEAVAAGATVIMLDNMSIERVAGCVAQLRADGVETLVEVSGGVDLEAAPKLATAGADLISVGALTHSAPVLDLGFDLAPPPVEKG